MGFQSLGQEDSLEEEMVIHPVILPGKSCGQRSLVGYGPWGHKELDMTATKHSTSTAFQIKFLMEVLIAAINNS